MHQEMDFVRIPNMQLYIKLRIESSEFQIALTCSFMLIGHFDVSKVWMKYTTTTQTTTRFISEYSAGDEDCVDKIPWYQ